MTYIIIISLAALLISLGCFLFEGVYTLRAFFVLLLGTGIEIAAVLAIDGVLAFVIRRLPEGWFSPDKKIFSVSAREVLLYRRLWISKWKKHIPELGCFTGFHKDHILEPRNVAYIGRFLLESNYGVAGHIAGAVGGFLLLLLPSRRIGFFVALVNFILNLLPTAVLRSNTLSLSRVYQRLLSREAQKNGENALLCEKKR